MSDRERMSLSREGPPGVGSFFLRFHHMPVAALVLPVVVSLAFGLYHVANMTVIAEDGVDYICYARALSAEPVKVLGDPSTYAGSPYPPGYPAVICAVYKLSCLLGLGGSLAAWIHSAQAASLACRLLGLVLLYFIAAEFVARRFAFWAVLIFSLLPYPVQIGSDVLREWPYLLFLAAGFLLLIRAAKLQIWWLFGAAGLVSGLGYLIRPASAQLVFYGIFWLGLCLAGRAGEAGMVRRRAAAALAVLIVGFLVVAGPYSAVRGKLLPYRVHEAMETLSADSDSPGLRPAEQPEKTIPGTFFRREKRYLVSFFPFVAARGSIPRAALLLGRRLAELFSYYFLPFALLGLYRHLRGRRRNHLELLLILFLLVNAAMPLARHFFFASSFSRRYVLPLAAFMVFFVPAGLEAAGAAIADYVRRLQGGRVSAVGSAGLYFLVLVAIGAALCMPRLLRPARLEKRGYLSAATWLRRNTAMEDTIAVPDARIAFYAERKARKLQPHRMGADLDFVVGEVKLWGDLNRKVCYCDVNIVGHPLYGTDRVIEYLLLKDFKRDNPAGVELDFNVPQGRPRCEFRVYVFGGNDCAVGAIELAAADGQAIDMLNGSYALATQTGLIDYQQRLVRSKDAAEGFLVYGPYIPLDAGRHTVRFSVRLNNPHYWQESPPGMAKAAEFSLNPAAAGGDKLVIYRRR